jgi:hypothetical protein
MAHHQRYKRRLLPTRAQTNNLFRNHLANLTKQFTTLAEGGKPRLFTHPDNTRLLDELSKYKPIITP